MVNECHVIVSGVHTNLNEQRVFEGCGATVRIK